MVNFTRRFIVSLALRFVLVFFIPFNNAITSLGEERAGLCPLRAFVCFARGNTEYKSPHRMPA